MKYIEFWQERYPEEYKKSYEESLFNSEEHLTLQSKEGWLHYYVVNHGHRSVMAQFSCCIDKGVAKSPLRSPFGAIEFDEQLPVASLYKFVEFVHDCLRDAGVTKIQVKCFPQSYNHSNFIKLTNAFFNLDYRVINSEFSSGLSIDEAGFQDKIYPSENGRLKKCYARGLQFEEVGLEGFEEIFRLIESCYAERGYRLSMDYEALKATVEALPDSFKLFAINNGANRISGSISIIVNSQILYNFYSAHIKAYDGVSPAVQLFEGIYGFCQSFGFRLLDLGTSALDGMPNFNLLRFKQQIGADLSLKLTFEKQLTLPT